MRCVRTGELEGHPYFAINFLDVTWPRGDKIHHAVDLLLPRGVLQSGKVVDAAGRLVLHAAKVGKPAGGA